MSHVKAIALNALVSLLIVGLALAAYHRYVATEAMRIGVVDLGEVYRLKEQAFAERVTRAGATEADRDRAVAEARAFARNLPGLLQALPGQCQCLVLLASAVAAPAPGLIDLTPALRRRVGL